MSHKTAEKLSKIRGLRSTSFSGLRKTREAGNSMMKMRSILESYTFFRI